MHNALFIVFPDGSHYDLATDAASVPTGVYGTDWAVISAADAAAAKRSAWRWSRPGWTDALPDGIVSEGLARRAMAERTVVGR